MTELSSAAQAVLDAANSASSYGPDDCLNDARQIAVAALRAAADQIVPPQALCSHPDEYDFGVWEAKDWVRNGLLAIADELEAQ